MPPVLRLSILCLALPLAALGQDATPLRCSDIDTYRALDFWVGDWDVYVRNERVGHDRVEKILDGCAMIENWTDAAGNEGMSLFFVDYDGQWAQVWVTGQAMLPGGTKEKVMVDDPPEGSVRFQGVVRHPDDGAWLDRTTLTPQDGGRVRQLIEVSRDNGLTWNPTFDAIYRPAGARQPPPPGPDG